MISRAARHLEKARHYQDQADDVLRWVRAFTTAGEVDKDGIPPGDNDEARRLLDIHGKLISKVQRHASKADRILANIRID